MIIDIHQGRDNFQLSYVNEKSEIELISIPLLHGYYRYIPTDVYDTVDIVKGLKSFKHGSQIKRIPDKYFSGHNLNEFINHDIKEYHKDIWDKISLLKIPPPVSIDIETEINEENGYSTAEIAANKILSISITDTTTMSTVIFELKNSGNCDVDNKNITDLDNIKIKTILDDLLGEKYTSKYSFNFVRRVFDSEVDMLNVFLECINKYFKAIIGWNFEIYDWLYIYNRCLNLGIKVQKCSPIGKMKKKRIETKHDSYIIHKPVHRIIGDYMFMFKDSLIYNNLGSYSLESCSQLVLGVGKVAYEGNLKTLYEKDYNKFIAYALVDTILVSLIHITTNLYNIDFFESYMNGIPYSMISQNGISEALIYSTNREDGLFLPKEEWNKVEKQKYPGGYVKNPTKKITMASIGEDYSGLYPNCILTGGISPDRKIDFIKVDELGRPADEQNFKIWESYKAQNCILVPTGRIYQRIEGNDGIYVKIEKKLISNRKIYKGHAEDIYLNMIPKIEKLIASIA